MSKKSELSDAARRMSQQRKIRVSAFNNRELARKASRLSHLRRGHKVKDEITQEETKED